MNTLPNHNSTITRVFTPSLSASGQAALILFMLCALLSVSLAQVRQTSLYVDNGSGAFAQIKATNLTSGQTFQFPTTGGTLLTAGGGASSAVNFDPTSAQTATDANYLFNITDAPPAGAAPGAYLSSSGNADNSRSATTGLTIAANDADTGILLGTVTGLSITGGNGLNDYGITFNIGGTNAYDIQGSGNHWLVTSNGAATFNTSVSTPKLRGAATNHYAELHTVSATEAGAISGNTVTISNSDIAGTSSVIIATLSSAAGVATFIKSAKATGAGTAAITLDNTPAQGDVYNLIIVNP